MSSETILEYFPTSWFKKIVSLSWIVGFLGYVIHLSDKKREKHFLTVFPHKISQGSFSFLVGCVIPFFSSGFIFTSWLTQPKAIESIQENSMRLLSWMHLSTKQIEYVVQVEKGQPISVGLWSQKNKGSHM